MRTPHRSVLSFFLGTLCSPLSASGLHSPSPSLTCTGFSTCHSTGRRELEPWWAQQALPLSQSSCAPPSSMGAPDPGRPCRRGFPHLHSPIAVSHLLFSPEDQIAEPEFPSVWRGAALGREGPLSDKATLRSFDFLLRHPSATISKHRLQLCLFPCILVNTFPGFGMGVLLRLPW